MSLSEDDVKEVFKLFDQDGSGIKIKEIGTVLRSLGLSAKEASLRLYSEDAQKKDKNFVQFGDFMNYVKQAQTEETDNVIDVAKELEGMKLGIHHFFDKLPAKQIRDSPPEMVKIADLKHLLSSVGEKMTEEECEDMAREIRNVCKVEDGKVKFADFVEMLK
eukprot:TRINITY_DN93667_c0_g1_i1.p1 TRINITY_DN93667_c0_g1~~TRINITY_DN93667_c0_g1_i1.p1  ORF type:complete len:162 (-),score=67.51 TRINITY_DN93667_c0_g1_i1:338-823(-)